VFAEGDLFEQRNKARMQAALKVYVRERVAADERGEVLAAVAGHVRERGLRLPDGLPLPPGGAAAGSGAPATESTRKRLYEMASGRQVDQLRAMCRHWSGHGEVLNWANPLNVGNTPLHMAVDSPECTAILVSTPGTDANKADHDGWTPLWCAAINGQAKTVKALLAAPGIGINQAPTRGGVKGKSPLTIARENPKCKEGCQEVVGLLEGAGAR